MRSAAILGLAGGFAYGVRRGGGDVEVAYENGFGRPLVELNLPGTVYAYGLPGRVRHDVDFAFGCPPCAGWSTASAGLDRKDNPEHEINDGIRTWFAGVETLRPAVACYESVLGHLRRGQGLWGPLARRLEEDGYRWSFVVYDNQDMGVPQKRERMTFWAWRTGREFEPEEPLRPPHRDVATALGGRSFDPTFHQAMTDRMPVHRLLPYVSCGSNVRRVPTETWLEHYHEPGVRDGWPSFTFRRLHPHRPAPVMMANALTTTVHYDDMLYPYLNADRDLVPNPACRLITGNELAILMGYPESFRLRWFDHEGPATPAERTQLSAWLTQAVSPAIGSWTAQTASVHLEAAEPAATWEPRVWDLRRGRRNLGSPWGWTG
jgi:site-specific DNA-cytosine methylase